MITFLDENDVEYGALATIKVTNAVNGERSLTGTIASGDYVLSNIERGWRLRFDDEYYVVTYAKPIDEGRDVQVEFDAVHQFFWDFDKSSVYDQLSDGSHTFRAYLDFIFKNSGYSYTVDSALNVYAFEKQSFGFKKRLTLFNDIITSTGVEFQVNGKVVRILEKVGTDLSTIVRKNFNMNELTIEKNIGDFVTYQKGFGAYFDEEDHSKGRLEVEYTSPLANVYGKLEAEPFVDERYSQSSSLLAVLKENVDNSYTISVSLDMEDLTRAGYKYKQPVAGDYIMAINETLGFKEKIRIVSFTSEYDVQGILVKHGVTCNDIGSVKKLSASYTHTQHQAANAEANANTAYEFANKALISADGKNTNYYGDSFPVDNPKGTLKTGDLLFLTVGDTVKQYYWNGADWVINPVLDDVEAFKEQIAEELKDVPNREEFENKIAEELATSKAEIETQIETAKTQAESNAKEYADTINQETAKVAEQANTAADEIKADLVNVKNNLTDTSLVANNAQAAVDAAKQELTEVANELSTAKQDITQTKQQLTNVSNDLSKAKTDLQNAVSAVDTKAANLQSDLTQAKQDLNSQAQQLQEQANAQSELTKRVSSVEKTANGTKTTVSELSKTVAQNGKDITSVTARTKVVEDDLAGTKTTLSQVQTTADSTSQKTATLETGLNGLSAKFENLKIGSVNLLHNSKGPFQPKNSRIDNYTVYQNTWINMEQGKEYTLSAKGSAPFTSKHATDQEKNEICLWLVNGSDINRIISSSTTGTDGTTFTWNEPSGRYYLRVNTYKADNSNYAEKVQIEEGNLRSTYSQNESDIESKVAEYKQNADQNYASLQTTVQNLDGTVQHNKTVADQTAQGFKTRIESLETYKDGESERANAYFESAKTETAKQLTAERTAIANNYVAKSTYTSDVTGIRNELSATTSTANATKTNLANYQASNDKMVASLKSSLQTTDGNVSNLQTKVEAVPGQITSAVSAVEGKIPKELGGRNLYALSKNAGIYTRDFTDFVQSVETGEISFKVTGRDPFFGSVAMKDEAVGTARGVKIPVKTGQGIAVWVTNPIFIKNFVSYFGDDDRAVKNYKDYPTNKFVIPSSELAGVSYVAFRFGLVEDTQEVGSVHSTKVKVEYGNVYTDWSPAPEDTASQISNLSSEIKQTADGMTLLATKTELNSAKTELQSGINTATNKANSNAQTISTHTTQISALNTGLQAKVSQTEFNTLSGRVTNAENSITAKANELSSKISSVEGKIPSGEMNLVEYGRPADGYSPYAGAEYATHPFYYNGTYKMYIIKNSTTSEEKLGLNRFKVERNTEYTLYFKAFNNGNITNMDVLFLKRVSGSTNGFDSAQQLVSARKLSTSKAEDVSVTFNTGNYDEGYLRFDNNGTMIAGTSADLYFGDVSVKKGKSNAGWSPSLAELASSQDLKSAQSEIKQTQSGMTLLATKTELNSAKNELQSGINTATNKANSAQSAANNNAQTISTHTTQISALNAGLSAKVSQSDFNTLTGRVTTAENNITAKANELSSKITSVEGKIPSGEMNLVEYGRPADGYSPYNNVEYATHPFYYNGAYKMYIIKNAATSEKVVWMNRFKVERNTDYTLFFKGFNNGAITSMDVFFLKRTSGSTNAFDSAQQLVSARKLSTSKAEDVSVTFNTGEYDEGFLRFDNNGTATAGTQADLYFGDVSVKKGKSNSGWSPSLAELASSKDLKTAQSEFKQTTDAIKASVSSLDGSTVKSSSLTINADGIVMKAGKSTTDVANAIGSYFAVNQNAINLFSDKINVKGNMIVSGAITSDKIASKQINTAHLNGKIITADVIATNAITADAIKAGAVTTDKMSANSINGDRITAGTLDAAKIKAGSITASQIASGTITSNQIKAGGISAANIAAGAITGDKIAAGAIDANKIAANAITANMIRGGQLRSTNEATVFDLNAGSIAFNNDAGYIQRVAGNKIFAIQTWLARHSDSQDYLASRFSIRNSANNRRSGIQYQLNEGMEDKPTACADMWTDLFNINDSSGLRVFSLNMKNNVKPEWWNHPIATLNGGLIIYDISIVGHSKSLLNVVQELCNKTGIVWD